MNGFVFLAAIIGAPLILGLPVAVQPSLTRLSLAARASLAWAVGCLFLTVILTLLSATGLAWTPWWIVLACIVALATTSIPIRTSRATALAPAVSAHPRFSFASLCFVLIAGSGLFAFVFGFATSADLSYFWGVKAAHFALERGIDFDLLRQPFMVHLHPNYPPLWPVLLGWGAMIAGSIPWLAIAPLTWLCLTATAVIIFSLLEERLERRAATLVTCLWYATLTTIMATSFSGGNADGFLLLFSSLALIVILTESESDRAHMRWLAAVALAGAVFTKSEGIVAASFIAAGTLIRDIAWRRQAIFRQTVFLIAPAAVTASLWVLIRMAHNIRLTDPIRETAFQISFDHIGLILKVCARILTTEVFVVGWLAPLVAVLIVGHRCLHRGIPAVFTAVGILGFAVIYYLHAVGDPLQLIVWTFPRLMQPAISAWVLGCGVAVFSVVSERHPKNAAAPETSR
jgi:hypothetical protein